MEQPSTRKNPLRRRADALTAIYEISSLLAGTGDVQRILDKTAEKVCAVMDASACSIRLLARDTNALVIRAVHNLSSEYLNKGPVTVSDNPIDAAALAGESVYVEDAPTDPRTRYPRQARKEGIRSALAVGMLCQGRPVGVIRVYTGIPRRFDRTDKRLLRALASQAAAAIVNARLHREAREAERWERQIKRAGDVQRRMIPARPPTLSGVSFGAAYAPTLEVGGDFYDFIELPWGDVGVAIADVVGKGFPAALMMASLRSALRVYAHTVHEIDEIMGNVNRHFHRDTLLSEFATAVYGVLSPDGRALTYCNAGHNPPVLLRDGNVHLLETGGMVLGVHRDERYAKEVVKLRAGDVLLLYTDGVLDAVNFADEAFGYDRMIRSLRAKRDMPAPFIARDLLLDVRRFVGLAPQADDLTLVTVKVE